MGTEQSPESTPVVVTEKSLRMIEARLKTRFRAFFRPGEKIKLAVEDEEDFVYCKFTLTLPDGSFCLDLEAAVIVQDQEKLFVDATTSRARQLGAIEFLSSQLDHYFRSQRQERFHIDWRIYDFEAARIRFRGELRHPELERQAAKLLAETSEEPQ